MTHLNNHSNKGLDQKYTVSGFTSFCSLLFLLLMLLLLSSVADPENYSSANNYAAANTNFSGTGNWTDQANWSPTYPGTLVQDEVFIDGGANCTISPGTTIAIRPASESRRYVTVTSGGLLTVADGAVLQTNGPYSYNAGVWVDGILDVAPTGTFSSNHFAGTGTIQGTDVNSSRSIEPAGPGATGTLTFAQNLGGSMRDYNCEVFGPTAGTDYDQVAVGGTITQSGALNVDFGSFTPQNGQVFQIVTAGSFAGSFQQIQITPASISVDYDETTGQLTVVGGGITPTFTWDNDSGDGLWSTAANWSDDIVPGPGDNVVFNGIVSNSNCTVDVVAEVANLTISYAGDLRLNNKISVTSNFLLENARLITGVEAIEIQGDLVVNDLSYGNAASAKLVLNGATDQKISGSGICHNLEVQKTGGRVLLLDDLILSSGELSGAGSIVNAGGLVVLSGANNDYTFDFAGSIDDLEFANFFRKVTLAQDLTINNDLYITSVATLVGDNDYLISGNVITADADFSAGNNSSNIVFVGTTDQTISGRGALHDVEIRKPSGDVLINENVNFFNGTLTGSGNIRSNGGRIVSRGANRDYTFDFAGSIDDLEFASNFRTVTLAQDLTINNDLYITSVALLFGNKDYLVSGNVITADNDYESNNTSNIKLVGTADQSISGPGVIHDLTYAKPSGNLIKGADFDFNFTNVLLSAGNWQLNQPVGVSNSFTVSGGTLSGTGPINGNVTADGGTINPGNAFGCFTINGNLTLGEGTTSTFELDGSAACTEFDQLIVNGSVNINNATLEVLTTTPPTGEIILINNDGTDGISGSKFLGQPEGSTIEINGTPYEVIYSGGDGNDFSLSPACNATITSIDVATDCPGTITINATCSTCVDGLLYTVEGEQPQNDGQFDNLDPGTYNVTVADVNNPGCSATTSITITADTEAPTISCPGNITATATSAAGAEVTFAAPTGTDNCDGATTTQTAGLASGGTFPLGTTIVEFTVTDAAGLTASCSFEVTVAGIAPVITCPTPITVNTAAGLCEAAVDFTATAVGIPDATITYSQQPGTVFQAGVTTVTATATNAVGSDACVITITVADNEDPVLPVLADLTGECVVTAVPPVATDNCAGAVTATTNGPTTFTTVGTETITWTFDDGNGNIVTATQNVTVTDTEPPVLTCPQPIIVSTRSNSCDRVVNFPIATGLDNCSVEAFNFFNGGEPNDFGSGEDYLEMLPNGTWNDLPNGSLRRGIVEFNVLTSATFAGYTSLGQFGGHTYYYALASTPWLTARANAQAIGGDLASMNSQEENDFINNQNVRGWVGGFHDQNDPAFVEPGNSSQNFGGWRWTDGTRLGAGQIFIVQTSGPVSGTSFGLGVTEVTFTGTDEAGNASSCSFNVTVVDDTPPVLPTLATITGECTATATVPTTTDNCAGLITGTTTDDLTYDVQGTYTITWSFADDNGNVSTANQTVIVNDVTAPVVSCPTDITVANDAGLCSAVVNYTASATDNCTSGPALSYSTASGAEFALGTTEVTVSANDGNGNVATCSFSVTVNDTEAPVAACNNIDVVLTDRNTYSLTQANIDALAAGTTDNCAGVTYAITAGTTTYNCDNRTETFVVTLTATDAAGLTNNCEATVTVTDPNSVCNEPPVAVCNPVTVDADVNCTGAAAGADFGLNSNDPDGDALTFSVSPEGPYTLGTTPVTLTVSDGEFSATCTTTITVVDNTAPTAICAEAINISLDANGSATIAAASIDAGSFDNCGIQHVTLDLTTFDCSSVGENTVTLTVTDNAGLVNVCTSSVMVEDNIAPSVVCQDITVQLDANGNGNLIPADINAGSSDACGIADLSFGGGDELVVNGTFDNNFTGWTTNSSLRNDGNPGRSVYLNQSGQLNSDPFVAQVVNGFIPGNTYQLTGDNRNVANCCGEFEGQPALAIDIDGIERTIIANPGSPWTPFSYTFVATASSHEIRFRAEINGNDTDQGLDNVSIIGVGGNATVAFGCADVGTNTVTLIGSDNNGNVSTCSATVTVEDNVAPAAQCQDVTVQLDANGNGSISAADIDNGSSDACGIASLSLDNDTFGCADVGANTVTLTAADNNGNVSTCSATVTVEDNVAPAAECQDITVQLDANGLATITNSSVDNGSADACGIASIATNVTAFDCADLGANTVLLTVTDNNGNVNTCSTTVTVVDNIAPTIMGCSDDMTVTAVTGDCSALVALPIPVINDNCETTIAVVCDAPGSNIINNELGLFPVGTSTVRCIVTDAAGNADTCAFDITVIDAEAPVITGCPASDIVTNNDEDECGAEVFYGIITASDNCPGVTLDPVSGNMVDGDYFPVGTTPVTFIATDAVGNQSTCSFNVTVNDSEAPTIVCPAAISQANDESGCGATVTLPVPTTADNCGVSNISVTAGSVVITDGTGFFPIGSTTVTYAVADEAGNETTCTFNVVVTDTEAPLLPNCPRETVTALSAADQCGAEVLYEAIFVDDNCAGASITAQSHGLAGDFFPVGTTTVSISAVDAAGNTADCTFDVTVTDNIAPILVCRTTTIGLDDQGQGNLSLFDVFLEATDNCALSNVTPTLSSTSFDCNDIGLQQVTVSASDIYGNIGSCTVDLTVVDNVAPQAVCNEATVVLNDDGNGTITAAALDGGSSDACGIAGISIPPTVFNCNNIGDNSISLIVTDNNGNTSTCNANVTVVDNNAPTAICAPLTVALDVNGSATIDPSSLDGGSGDACGIASFTASQTIFSCSDVGSQEITLTVADNNGNSSSCTSTVTIEDITAPVIECQATTIVLDAITGIANLTVADVQLSADDACGIASTILDISSFDCNNTNADNLVTLTATDVNGNSSSCIATVTVLDETAPTAVCDAQVSVVLGGDGTGVLTPQRIDDGSTDACGIATLALDITMFDCDDVGDNLVTLTVTDNNGNFSTCTSVVNVIDKNTPDVQCQDVAISLDDNGLATVDPAQVNDGSSDGCGLATLSLDVSTFDCTQVGDNTVTLTVTDNNGLFSLCTATITVVDNSAPTAVCQDITLPLNAITGSATLTADMIDGGSTDNCSVVSYSVNTTLFDCSDIGNNVVTLTATDAAGFTSQCTANVTVVDNTPPEVSCIDATVLLSDLGQAIITVEDVSVLSNDACGLREVFVDQTKFNCADAGTNLVTVTAVDVNLNQSTCTATVTVIDDIAPTAVCLDQTVVLDGISSQTITAEQVDAGSADNCGFSLSLDQSIITFSDYPLATVTLTVTDASGNTGQCTATVTVDVPCDNVTDGGQIGDDEFGCGAFDPAAITSYAPATGGGIAPIEYLWLSTTNPELPINQWVPVGNDVIYDPANISETTYFVRCARRLGCDVYAAESNVIAKVVNNEGVACGPDQQTVLVSGNAISTSQDNSVSWSHAILGEADGVGAQFYDYNDKMRVKLNDELPAGSEVTITWKRRNYFGFRPARLYVYEQSFGGQSHLNEVLYTQVKDFYINTTITIENDDVDELWLRNRWGFADFEIDAITYCATQCISTEEYCTPENISTEFEYIQRVKLDDINNWSGNDGGYGDYTHLSTDLCPGDERRIRLRPGFTGNSYIEYWRVYIDYDQNGEFDWYENAYQGRGRNEKSGWIHVPTWARHGETRMRVVMSYGGYHGPCDDDFEGEIEDYTVNIFRHRSLLRTAGSDEKPVEEQISETLLTDIVADRSDALPQTTLDVPDTNTPAMTPTMKVFPNPAKGPVTLTWDGFTADEVQLTITNQMGQVLLSRTLASEQHLLELSTTNITLRPGTYQVFLQTKDERLVKQLIITK